MGPACVTRETTTTIETFKMTTEVGNWTVPTTASPWKIKEFKGVIAEFVTLEVIWFVYCCTGLWAKSQAFRVLCLVEGFVRVLIVNVWRGEPTYTTSWFVAFLLGRLKIDTSKRGIMRMIILVTWLVLDLASMWYSPAYWARLVLEGLVVVGLLSYMYSQVSKLKGSHAPRWALKLLRLCLWGFGWGILSVLCLLGIITNLPLVVWFVLYGHLFPQPVRKEPSNGSPREERARTADTRRWTRGMEHIYEEVPL